MADKQETPEDTGEDDDETSSSSSTSENPDLLKQPGGHGPQQQSLLGFDGGRRAMHVHRLKDEEADCHGGKLTKTKDRSSRLIVEVVDGPLHTLP